jgi:hypothetical protein
VSVRVPIPTTLDEFEAYGLAWRAQSERVARIASMTASAGHGPATPLVSVDVPPTARPHGLRTLDEVAARWNREAQEKLERQAREHEENGPWRFARRIGLEREAVATVVRRFADGAHEYDIADEIARMVDYDPWDE